MGDFAWGHGKDRDGGKRYKGVVHEARGVSGKLTGGGANGLLGLLRKSKKGVRMTVAKNKYWGERPWGGKSATWM